MHGDKYDYSKAVYVRTHVNVVILCTTRGVFEQKPNVHLQGGGCQQCGTDLIRLIQVTGRLKKGCVLSFTDAEYAIGELAKAAKLGRSEYISDRLGLDK